jgi:2-keto-4-pentenoate hydratase/2-oxohepta-3-ene-1,7-dioic acid hydratase in catechol pathway
MRLTTIYWKHTETLGVVTETGVHPLTAINEAKGTDLPADLYTLLESGRFFDFQRWYETGGKTTLSGETAIPMEAAEFGPLFRRPGKIWGIGLNYRDHAKDLDASPPEGIPGGFLKPATAVIGCNEPIVIPSISRRTTAEAELGIVFGKTCKNVGKEDWRSVVAGFTGVIDMTAEDLLRQNLRYLTLAKSFDTFFSFGPVLITPDELPDVYPLRVTTVINNRVHAENVVQNMTYPPDTLVSLLTSWMTFHPGDILSTGTPGAVPIADKDVVACRITGFPTLSNPVAGGE